MWSQTLEGRRLIHEISYGVIVQVAPEEEDLFDDLIREYFRDPRPPRQLPSHFDDALGFGLSEALIAVTPAAAAMVSAVLGHLLTAAVGSVQDESAQAVRKRIKAMFNPEKPGKDFTPLTKDQMVLVKELARKQAVKFGVATVQAEKMADALIGSLALA